MDCARGHTMGRIHSTLSPTAFLFILAWVTPIAMAQAMTRFDLPAQPLADSLRAVGSETNTNILFDPPLVARHMAPALKAEVSVDQALTRLLAGTGIKYDGCAFRCPQCVGAAGSRRYEIDPSLRRFGAI
jgi:hypothetical protein